ncbi:hypothetical protein Tco_0788709 [Tanacetum coccineum]
MITYLKNMEGWKHKDLKYKDINSIKELFDKSLKRVNMFVDFRTELVEGSSKRAGTKLEQEVTKKQKVDDVQETTEVDNDQEATKIKKLMQDLEDLYKLVKAKYKSTRLVEDLDLLLWNDLKGRIVGIKSSFMLFVVNTALIDVNAAQSKLVLLDNLNENYSKCLRLLVEVTTTSIKLLLLEEVTTARGSYYC